MMKVFPCPGAQVRYIDSGGDGPAVVLTHGAGVDHAMFDPQADALAQAGYRPILWDMRGHGQSTLDQGVRFTAPDALADLAGLLDHLGLGHPVLVGHSLGGNLSQAFVKAHPDRTGGLIVLDSTWNTGPLTRLERFSLRLAAPSLRLIPASRLPGMMARASAIAPAAIEQAAAVFAQMPKDRFLDVWRATVTLLDPDPAYRIPVPLALIRGDHDRTGNIATAMPRWAQAEGVPEHVIPGAGHIVTLDAPDVTSRALIQTLQRWHADDSPTRQADR